MQKRLIAAVVGGLVGIGLAYRFQDDFSMPETLAYIACGFAGMAIGWVASTLFDVFSASPDVTPPDVHK